MPNNNEIDNVENNVEVSESLIDTTERKVVDPIEADQFAVLFDNAEDDMKYENAELGIKVLFVNKQVLDEEKNVTEGKVAYLQIENDSAKLIRKAEKQRMKATDKESLLLVRLVNGKKSLVMRANDLGNNVVKEITTAADFSRDVIKQEVSKEDYANLKSTQIVCKNGGVKTAAVIGLSVVLGLTAFVGVGVAIGKSVENGRIEEEKKQVVNDRDNLNDLLVANYLKAIEDASAKATASRPAKLEYVGAVSADGIIQTQSTNSEFVMKSSVSVNTTEGKTDVYVKWFENDGSNEKYKYAQVLKYTNSDGNEITISKYDSQYSPLTQALNKFNENCSIKDDEIGSMSAFDVVSGTELSKLDNNRSIVAADGTVYVITEKGNLYTLDNVKVNQSGNALYSEGETSGKAVTAENISDVSVKRIDGVVFKTEEITEANGIKFNTYKNFISEALGINVNKQGNVEEYMSNVYISLDAADAGKNKYSASLKVFDMNANNGAGRVVELDAKTIVYTGDAEELNHMTQTELSAKVIGTYFNSAYTASWHQEGQKVTISGGTTSTSTDAGISR